MNPEKIKQFENQTGFELYSIEDDEIYMFDDYLVNYETVKQALEKAATQEEFKEWYWFTIEYTGENVNLAKYVELKRNESFKNLDFDTFNRKIIEISELL